MADAFRKALDPNSTEPEDRLPFQYPEQKDVDKAVYQLQAHARRREKCKPEIRIINHDNALWLDLGRQDWQGIRVTAQGWEIVKRIAAPLVRGQGMLELPLPERGGDISTLREFANVRDDEDFVLFCGTAVGLFSRFGHYTTTIFCGPAGSGKTTATKILAQMLVRWIYCRWCIAAHANRLRPGYEQQHWLFLSRARS